MSGEGMTARGGERQPRVVPSTSVDLDAERSPEPLTERKKTARIPERAVIDAIGEEHEDRQEKAKSQLNRQDQLSLFFVFFSVFVDIMGVSIVQPILPFYAEALGASPTQLGALYSSYAGFGLIASQVMGRISDSFGRRPALLFSILGSAVGYFLTAQATRFDYWFLFGCRCVGGLFSSSMPVAQAAITDVVPPDDRPKFLAGLGSTVALSFVIGPGIGSGLAEFGINVPFYVSGFMAIFGFIFAFFMLRETSPKFNTDAELSTTESVSSIDSAGSEEEHEEVAPIPFMVYIVGIYGFCAMVSWTAFTSMYALFMFEKYRWGSLQIGFSTLCTALIYIVSNMIAFNFFNAKFGLTGASIIGSAYMAIACALLPIPNNVWGTLAVVTFGIPLAQGVAMPSISSMIASYAHPSNRGVVMGLNSMFTNLGMIVGPLVHGTVFAINIGAPFWVGAGTSVIGVFVGVGVILTGNATCGPPKHEDESDIEAPLTTWTWEPDAVTDEDYMKLGRFLGDLYTKNNYKWVTHFDKVQETLTRIFPPVRISSLEDHMEDIRMIRRNAEAFYTDYSHLAEHSKMKYM